MKNGFAHLFLVFVVAVLGIGALGYFAFKNGQIKTINPTASVPASNTDIDIDISNWKTYTGNSFSIKYPEHLFSIETKARNAVELFKNQNHADSYYSCIENEAGTLENPCEEPLIWIALTTENMKSLPTTKDNQSLHSETIVNGLTVVTNKDLIHINGLTAVKESYFVKNNKLYKLNIQTLPEGYYNTQFPSNNAGEEEKYNYELVLLNQILSTFKFNDNESVNINSEYTPQLFPSLHWATPAQGESLDEVVRVEKDGRYKDLKLLGKVWRASKENLSREELREIQTAFLSHASNENTKTGLDWNASYDGYEFKSLDASGPLSSVFGVVGVSDGKLKLYQWQEKTEMLGEYPINSHCPCKFEVEHFASEETSVEELINKFNE